MKIVPVVGDLLFAPHLASGHDVIISKERVEARDAYLLALEKDVQLTLIDMQQRCHHHMEDGICRYCGMEEK